MRRIAHISDLHFGTEDVPVASALLNDLSRQDPDLVVVSGDLTQRARQHEFIAAKNYLDRISAPQIVVPGNHDIPLYNVLDRWLRPLSNYCHHITTDLHPFYFDAEIAVAGVNTARSNTWKEGRVSLSQIERFREQFESVPPHLFKMLVSHHPFIPPEHRLEEAVVGRGPLALRTLQKCGCSLILSGHLHHAYSGDVRTHHLEITRSIIVAQAGTAISRRRRDEPNAYNQVTVNGEELELEVRAWNGTQFAVTGQRKYRHSPDGWLSIG